MPQPGPAQTLSDRLKDSLRFSRTGRFYKLSQELTDADHQLLVNKVARPHVDKHAQKLSGLDGPEFKIVRSADLGSWVTTGATVEAYGTLYLQPVLEYPAVGLVASGLHELRFAHVLILEGAVKKGKKLGQRYAFVNCDILDDPLQESNLVTPLTRAEMVNPFLSSSLISGEEVRIEELNMRIMNMSRVGLRRKAVEAYDVEASVSSLGLHRSIPGTMKIRLPRSAGVGTAVTISAGGQSVRAGSSRVKLTTVTEWFAQCIIRLDAENGALGLRNTFLSEMAEPLDTLDNLEPSSLLLDFSALEESGFGSSLQWLRDLKSPKAWKDDSFVQVAFDEPIELTKVALPVTLTATTTPTLGAIGSPAKPSSITTASIAVAPTPPIRLYVGKIDDGEGKVVMINLEVLGSSCRLVQADPAVLGSVKGSGSSVTFEQAVTRAKALRVAFDGGRVLYTAEGPHRSGNLKLAIQKLQASIRGVKAFDVIKSEKGEDTIKPADTSFPAQSCFHAIETSLEVTATNSTLVCGDGRVEVFDYLDIVDKPPRLRWLHAKVQQKSTIADQVAAKAANQAKPAGTKKVKAPRIPMGNTSGSLSASALQEVVGQAVKNLAFLRRDPLDPTFTNEVDRWKKTCDLPIATKIKRVRRGSDPAGKVKAIINDGSAQQEVAIVVPSYSKSKLGAQFAAIESGQADQHTIQLFWLLSAFASSCLEVGVTPLIFMRD